MIELVSGVILAVFVSAVVRRCLAVRATARLYRRFYREKFFDLAHRMADNAPSNANCAEMRRMTGMLNGMAAFLQVFRLLRDAERDLRAGVVPDRRDEPAAVTRDAVILLYLAVMALSYDRWLAGPLLRARLALLLDPSSAERAGLLLDQRLAQA